VRPIVGDALEIIEVRKHAEDQGRDASRFTTGLLKVNRARLEIQTSPSNRDRQLVGFW
jgi:hypothetical protein